MAHVIHYQMARTTDVRTHRALFGSVLPDSSRFSDPCSCMCIAVVVLHVLRRKASRSCLSVPGTSPALLRCVCSHAWRCSDVKPFRKLLGALNREEKDIPSFPGARQSVLSICPLVLSLSPPCVSLSLSLCWAACSPLAHVYVLSGCAVYEGRAATSDPGTTPGQGSAQEREGVRHSLSLHKPSDLYRCTPRTIGFAKLLRRWTLTLTRTRTNCTTVYARLHPAGLCEVCCTPFTHVLPVGEPCLIPRAPQR